MIFLTKAASVRLSPGGTPSATIHSQDVETTMVARKAEKK
jgi:hypothetical protein